MTMNSILAILIAAIMLTACTEATTPPEPVGSDKTVATPPPAVKPAMAGKVTTRTLRRGPDSHLRQPR